MPLVRYRTGDVARFLPYEVCSCGRTFQRISRVKGRVDHVINVQGVKVLPFDVDEIIQSIPEFQGEFQITVENPGILDKLKVKAESKAGEERYGELKQRLESELTKALTVPTEVEVIPTGSLVRPGIKAQRIVRTYKK
jgi:phenylacetate-CoA ligase